MTNKRMKLSEIKLNDSTFINSQEPIKPRKIPSQNIIHRLHQRQTYGSNSKAFYTNIFPNFTVSGVNRPRCFLRKFTPDGKYFIAFSFDLSSLEIYAFKGCQAGQHLLEGVHGDSITEGADPATTKTSSIFFSFFTLLHTTKVINRQQAVLNRECSLFSDDSRFVIVGSVSSMPESLYPSHRDMYHCNECLGPHANFQLEDYSIHVVEVSTGILYDSINFKCDKIYLSHNQGIYLYKRTLAILSVQHQTIHIYQLSDNGFLFKCRSIGRFCFEDDEHLVSMATSKPLKSAYSFLPNHQPFLLHSSSLAASSIFSQANPDPSPYSIYNTPLSSTTSSQPFSVATRPSEWGRNEKVLCSLKHKLLVFLFKKMSAKGVSGGGGRKHLSNFYKYFDFLVKLKMWRMQMLDEDHLLIRYTTEEVVTMRSTDLNMQPSFFAVYNFKEGVFLCFYENTSRHLVNIFEDHSDLFRNSEHYHNPSFYHNRFNRFKSNLSSSKQGRKSDEIKRILGQLPIYAQSFSSSPYLDYSYFSYDNKWVSALERPKTSGDHAIRFFSSECGLFKFKMFTGLVGVKSPPSNLVTRRLVAFIFHPFEPFAISVQRTNSDYIANFHIRNSYSNLASTPAAQLNTHNNALINCLNATAAIAGVGSSGRTCSNSFANSLSVQHSRNTRIRSSQPMNHSNTSLFPPVPASLSTSNTALLTPDINRDTNSINTNANATTTNATTTNATTTTAATTIATTSNLSSPSAPVF